MNLMRLLCLLLIAVTSLSAQQYRAFWADAFNRGFKTPAEIDEMVDNAVAAKANAIFMQARRRGDVYYTKAIEPPAQDATYNPSFDALDYLIERAHTKGIEVHAWFVVSRLWTSAAPPADPRHFWHSHGPNATGDDFWLTVSSTGRNGDSIDLGHPAAARHIADLVTDVARNYPGIDGLHLDYIRYPEDADYGWNPKAIERFQRLENRTGRPAANDARWADFRRRQVTQLVRQIYLRANEIKPSIKISAALITWGSGPTGADLDGAYRRLDAYSRVFQDWRGWLEEGILDLGMPMNYFADARNGAFLDRWMAFEKERQFRRGLLVGLGIYLNPIEATLAQLERALAPSPGGVIPLGVALYSYASTNENNARPNREFYAAVGDRFGERVAPPVLPWKRDPIAGHAYGWLEIADGPEWLRDGATVIVESSAGRRTLLTDGNGFFGAVDLPPGEYRAVVMRAGQLVKSSALKPVAAGVTVPFSFVLTAADFAHVLPRLEAGLDAAAPGEIVTLRGVNLAAGPGFATAVPLPTELSQSQVTVNGEAAPLFEIAPDFVTLQIPYRLAEAWTIVVKNQGLESAPLTIAAVPARPAIVSVKRTAAEMVEIEATGLGLVDPVVVAGTGWSGVDPAPRTVEKTTVLVGEREWEAGFSGLTAYQPGKYRVLVAIPVAIAGELRLKVGAQLSAPAALP